MAKQLKLLILNASNDERQTIRATLERLSVFEFIEASDSQDALKILKNQKKEQINESRESSVSKEDKQLFEQFTKD